MHLGRLMRRPEADFQWPELRKRYSQVMSGIERGLHGLSTDDRLAIPKIALWEHSRALDAALAEGPEAFARGREAILLVLPQHGARGRGGAGPRICTIRV